MKKITALLALTGALALASPVVLAYPIHFTTTLTGASENPANPSPATGFARVTIDPVAHLLTVSATFDGLLGNTTASHIHCCIAPPGNAGVATQVPTFTAFPLGVTSGSFEQVFDTLADSTWRAGFITASGGTAAGAEAVFWQGLSSGQAYLNIHTSAFPAGEIRGFLQAPEPATFSLLALALAALGLRRRAMPH